MLRSVLLLFTVWMLFAAQSQASTIDFTITGNGIDSSGTLDLTASGTPGIDDITGITGTFSSINGGFSGTITGLNPGSYSASSPTGDDLSVWDNLFYEDESPPACDGGSTGGFLDVCGLDFVVANNYEVNVFGNGGGVNGYEVSDGTLGSDTYIDNNVVVTFSVTPEPSALVLLMIGLAAMASVAHRRLRKHVG